MKLLKTCILLAFLSLSAKAQVVSPGYPSLPLPDSLSKAIGTKVAVFGRIFECKHMQKQRRTLLYMGAKYPEQALIVIINDADSTNLKHNVQSIYYGKDVLATGIIQSNNSKLEMQVSDTLHLKIAVLKAVRY